MDNPERNLAKVIRGTADNCLDRGKLQSSLSSGIAPHGLGSSRSAGRPASEPHCETRRAIRGPA